MLQPICETEGHLEALSDKHGVSRQFLEALRPAVERIFSEVPAERRAEMLELLDETVERQAEIETILGRATVGLDHLRALNRKDGIGVAALEASRRQQAVRPERHHIERDPLRQAI